MKRKEVTKKFMMISKWKKSFVLFGYIEVFRRCNEKNVMLHHISLNSAEFSYIVDQ